MMVPRFVRVFEQRHRRLYYVAPAVVWAAVIFWASSQTREDLPDIDLPNIDKVAHLVVYCVLGFLVSRALSWGRGLSWRACAVACVMAVGYGLSDETHQLFVEGRFFSMYDFLFDALGAGLGVLFWRWVSWRFLEGSD